MKPPRRLLFCCLALSGVAGGVAAKMGFFKVIWVALLAAKKFVLLAIVAIGGWLSKLFGKKKSSASQDAA